MEPPKAIKQTPVEYPKELARLGFRAVVVLELRIDATGRVEKATVIQSNHPGFDKPAIDAALTWTFKPATRQGVPVPITVHQPMIFALSGMQDGGLDGFEVQRGPGAPLSSKGRDDQPAEPLNVALAVYPYDLLRENQKGEATVAVTVDQKGQLTDARIMTASAPEFGSAALAAVEQFTFAPASKAGSPIESAFRVELKFVPFPSQPLVQPPDIQLLKKERQQPESIVNGSKLDRPLKVVSQKGATVPLAMRNKSTSGKALVEFLIDETGNVALPRIVSADSPEFGYAAVQAVSQWRFEPPTLAGRKVTTRARIPFNFRSTPSEPSS